MTKDTVPFVMALVGGCQRLTPELNVSLMTESNFLPDSKGRGDRDPSTSTRSQCDRRCGLDRRLLSTADAAAFDACRKAGVKFIGIQKGAGSVPAQLIFQREGWPPLSVPAHGANFETINERLQGYRLIQVTFFSRYNPTTSIQREPSA